jgi:hypothetical protein
MRKMKRKGDIRLVQKRNQRRNVLAYRRGRRQAV